MLLKTLGGVKGVRGQQAYVKTCQAITRVQEGC